jgi:hypothetical protein
VATTSVIQERMATRAWVCIVWLAAGCGGNSVCKTAGAYDCFKPLTTEATPCGHAFATPGKLDASGHQCTFTDGVVIEWTGSAFDTGPTDGVYHFTIKKAGALCMAFDQDRQGSPVSTETTTTRITTTGGVYTEVESERAASITFTMTCPDGATFDDAEAHTCQQSTRHIALAYERSNSNVKLAIGTAGATTEKVELFACAP